MKEDALPPRDRDYRPPPMKPGELPSEYVRRLAITEHDLPPGPEDGACCCGAGKAGQWTAGVHHGRHRCGRVITRSGEERIDMIMRGLDPDAREPGAEG